MDGGMVGNQGSFGFIIASSWTPIWISAGPVDMDPTTASSSRPEMAGYAELWETLLMLMIVYPQTFQVVESLKSPHGWIVQVPFDMSPIPT
jgi:hypothetical protein